MNRHSCRALVGILVCLATRAPIESSHAAPPDGADPQPTNVAARLGSHRFVHLNPIRTLAFAPNGSLFAVSSEQACLWDPSTGQQLRCWKLASALRGALSRDGKAVAVAENNQQVHLYDVATGESMRRLKTKNHASHALTLSPDAGRLVTCCRTIFAELCQSSAPEVFAECLW
jgi:WD40 repeat protein